MTVKRVHAERVIAFRHHKPATGAEQTRRKAWGRQWGEAAHRWRLSRQPGSGAR